MMLRLHHTNGFGLVEILALIVVVGILAAMALQSMSVVLDDARLTGTKREMVMLSEAIAGNPSLTQGGLRSEFGYLGDNGAFPPTLQALFQNPGLATWNGPYLPQGIAEDSVGFKFDEWGRAYAYDGAVTLTSTGGGTTLTRKIGRSSDDFLVNTIAGRIVDNSGNPPGSVYADSIAVEISFPGGAGAIVTRSTNPGSSGLFAVDSLPAGRHPLRVIYLPEVDTLHRFVTVLPRNRGSLEYRFAESYFTAGSSESGVNDTLLFATFNADEDGFTYADNTFRSTSQPLYASGTWSGSAGYSGGGLEVELGGVNNNNITNMSGGWSITFTVPTTIAVTVSFWYELRQSNQYESDEYTEALMSVDGTLYGQNPNDYIDRIAGDGNGGSQITTGWQQFSANLGSLSVGNHTLIVGGFNNEKSSSNEESWISFDEILVVTGS
jgi:type II secretory pathway pseudopilin PulG